MKRIVMCLLLFLLMGCYNQNLSSAPQEKEKEPEFTPSVLMLKIQYRLNK
ncbi:MULTISPECIES: hypothetical protein [unclassified Granulicatella]|nr:MULTISPECIES: hypothetical protein [unclassified Granulicatella]MBF0780954.1 hypothetical protein [Granulicatella sp. 19428wC4_WM01]